MKVYAKIKTSQLIVKKMPYSDIVQKMILITEKILPLGSVVEVDIRELKLETEKPVSSIKAVIVDRFMKKETEAICAVLWDYLSVWGFKKAAVFHGTGNPHSNTLWLYRQAGRCVCCIDKAGDYKKRI